MKKVWFLKALKIIKDRVIMKKHNALKLTMGFLGKNLAMAFYYLKSLKYWVVCTFIYILVGLTTNLFLANQTLAWFLPSIEFGSINESVNDVQYIRWEIKAEMAYSVKVYMEDDDGNDFIIEFETKDDKDDDDYDTDHDDELIVRIDDDYYDGTKEIYESESISDLTSFHVSENNDVIYTFTSDPKVKKIGIYGNDFTFYSITLADNDDFNNPCWEKDASDWDNLNDLEDDDGKIDDETYTNIQFNNSNIHITLKLSNSYPSNFPYPIGSLNPGYTGYQQPYNPNGYQQPYNPNGYQQPYNPNGYQQPYNPNGLFIGGPFSNYNYSRSTPYATSYNPNLINSGFPPSSIGQYPYNVGAYPGNYSPGFSIANVPDPYSPNYWYRKPLGLY